MITDPTDWVVAIPSYQRANLIGGRALQTLQAGRVARERIYIFVADEAERAAYECALPRESYGKIVTGVKGLTAQRNFITDYFPDGALIVQSDDDVDSVYASPEKNSNAFSKVEDLASVFDAGFEVCSAAGARIWGLYPLFNPYFMGGGVTFDLRSIIGTLHGIVNDRRHRLTVPVKDDIERTIFYWLDDRAVVRFNDLAPKNKARTEAGGCMAFGRSHETSKIAADDLVARYPALVSHMKPRKGGHAEVRLNRFAK